MTEETLDEGMVFEESPRFGETQRPEDHVMVDVGRGGTVVRVNAGSEFVPTLERLADEYNYGGFYRVFLNGSEVLDPGDSPETIEAGMRIAITPYDKVG